MASVAEIAVQNAVNKRNAERQALLGNTNGASVPTNQAAADRLGAPVVPQAGVNLNASNPIQLISQGLSGATNALTAGNRRNATQQLNDAVEAVRLEKQGYDRNRQGQADQQAQQLNVAQVGNQDAQANAKVFELATAQVAADDKVAVDTALGGLNFSRPIDDATSFAELTKVADASNLTPAQKEQFINAGLERLGTQQGLVDTSEAPVGSFAQLKDGDGKVIGSFNNETGVRKLFDGVESGDSIGKDGYPTKWNDKQRAASGAALASYQISSDAINTIDGITQGDISNVTGLTSLGGAITPANRSSVGKFNQLLGQEFLGNVQQLKGLGSLSNAEGSKVTSAANALVDPETNTLKTGLDADFVQAQLQAVKSGYQNMQRIAEFTEKNGREPNIKEYREITPALGGDGNALTYGNTPVFEADIYKTMKDNNMTRVQVLNQLQGVN